jgi:hypothetical protein
MEQISDASDVEGVEADYQLPELLEAQYLVDMAMEIGLAKSQSGNIVTVDWIDIKAWRDLTGSVLMSNEVEAVKNLSGAYVSQYYDSLESNCVSPHQTAPQNIEVVVNKLNTLFTMLRGGKA